LGPNPTGSNIPADAWPYTGVAFYGHNWRNVGRIVINYSANEATYIALSMGNNLYMTELPTGQNTITLTRNNFEWDPFEWSKGNPPTGGLNMANVNGISINALGTNGRATNLVINSLIVEGLQIEDGPTFIRPRKTSNNRYGILIEKTPVSDLAEISVITPEPAQITLKISDNLGNVVYSANGRNDETFVWDLTNKAGRFVANGTYLVVVEAKSMSGQLLLYQSKLGVKR